MKHKLRNLPLIISGLAAVALGTVGFSTWVLAYQVKEDDVTTSVTVDGSKNKSIELKTEVLPSNNSIKLGESTGKHDGKFENGAFGTDIEATDFDIEVKATLRVTKDYLLKNELPTSISYDYHTDSVGFFTTSVNGIYRELSYPSVSSFEYVSLPSDTKIDVTKANLNTLTDHSKTFTSKEGWVAKLYEDYEAYILTKNLTLKFSWGSYFENKAPTLFYPYYFTHYTKVKEKYEEIYEESAYAQYFNDATVELNSMYKKIGNGEAKSLKLQATIK